MCCLMTHVYRGMGHVCPTSMQSKQWGGTCGRRDRLHLCSRIDGTRRGKRNFPRNVDHLVIPAVKMLSLVTTSSPDMCHETTHVYAVKSMGETLGNLSLTFSRCIFRRYGAVKSCWFNCSVVCQEVEPTWFNFSVVCPGSAAHAPPPLPR